MTHAIKISNDEATRLLASVKKYVVRHYRHFPDKDELISAGILGAFQSIGSWDHKKGAKILTWMVGGAKLAITQYIHNRIRTPTIPNLDSFSYSNDEDDLNIDFSGIESDFNFTAVNMLLEGKKLDDIALSFGVTRRTAFDRLRKLALRATSRRHAANADIDT